MINDYECPHCHNKFPESNKLLHDIRCTAENPVPNKENLIEISQNKPLIEEIKEIPKDSDVFECNICHLVMSGLEKADHILCHDLENQEKKKLKKLREIAEQKKIEKEIEKRNKQKKLIEQQRQIERQIQLNNRINQNQHQNHHQPQSQNSDNNQRHQNNNQINQANNINNIRNNHNNIPIPNNNRRINNHINHNNMNNNAHVHIRHRPQSINHLNNRIFINIRNDFNHINRNQVPPSRHEHPTDKQILNQLPETYIEDVNKLDSEKKNCVICLEDFKTGDKAVILPCIHIFHKSCIKNWLKKQNSCPICKYKLIAQNMNAQ